MPKHVLEGPFKSGNFGSAYNVNTPPDQIVTSGPWRVLQYVPGEKTVLGRNPYWFGVDKANRRLPYLDELVYLIVPDQDAADLKFRSASSTQSTTSSLRTIAGTRTTRRLAISRSTALDPR